MDELKFTQRHVQRYYFFIGWILIYAVLDKSKNFFVPLDLPPWIKEVNKVLSKPWVSFSEPLGHRHRTKRFSSSLWPSELSALQQETQKGVTQVILHMLLSCFFNTCTLYLCHLMLLSDINLWHFDNLLWVLDYRATVSIQDVLLTFNVEPISKGLVKFTTL